MMIRRLVLLVIALVMVAAACGGSDDEAGDGVASLSGAADDEVIAVPLPADEVVELTQEEALLAFTACLRDNGVDIEDPTVDAEGNVEFSFRRGAGPQDEGFDREAAGAAREACSDQLEGVTIGFRGLDTTELEDTFFEYAACMRDNDYEMNDPDFSNFGPGGGGGGGGGGGPFGVIDRDDPDFIAANEACSDILAGFGAGAGGGFGRGPGGGGGRPGGGGNG